MSEEELKQAVAAARKRGEKVVMTNGVFDILHAGHVSYLANARKLGDRLIVAVNSDASTKTSERRDPPGEPAGTADDRAGGAGSGRLGGVI